MTTGLIDFRAAVKFMQSRRWACVYADTKGLVLVRPDSAKFREAVKSDLKGVWFPDEDSRTLSRALLSHFMFGRIEPEVEDGLKSAAKRDPWPNYYTLITWGMAGVGSCFDRNTVQYLVSEALRLNGTDPARDKAGGQVLESLVRIYGILQENAVQCGEPEIGLRFQKLKNSAQNDYDRLRKSFLGRFL